MDLATAPVLGEPGPDISGLDTPFWEGLREGELRIQRCGGCGGWIWSPQWRCGDCGSWDMQWEETSAEGVVYSWTRTHHAFAPGLKEAVPFVTLLVELPKAGGKRLMGILIGDEAALKIGAPVVAVIQPPSERTNGQAILRWRLAEGGAQ